MNKFEQLIEYVINDEEQKARALFHDIVVGKSREIYENLMAEEAEEDLDESKDEDLEEDAMGGDAADDLIDDVEAEEQDDMSMEAEGDDQEELDVEMDAEVDGDDMGGDADGEEGLEDRVMDLEDKLDELMAEFEGLMGDDNMGNGDGFGPDEGGDAIEVDDTEEMMPEMGMGMMENVSLKAAPKPVTSEEGGINKKSTVAANAGAKGPIGSTVKPVSTTGAEAHGRPAPTAKELIGKVGNTPAQGTQKPSAATKPKLGQEGGVNNKSIVPGKHN
jgi:hypothetical protein